jgi:hypothetical protein
MANIILSNTDPNIIPNPPAGSTLMFFDLNSQPVLKDSLGVTQSLGGGGLGPQGSIGMTGPQGPSGNMNAVTLDWAAIGTQTTQGPYGVTQSHFITLPFSGQGSNRAGSGGTSIIGMTASNGFGCKLSTGGDGIGRAFKIMCAADIQAGNNKVLGLRLRMYGRTDEFSSWNTTDILLSECRAPTGVGTTFAKLFTEWIIVAGENDVEIVATIANFTDTAPLTIDRIKMVITDLGPVNP